MMRQLQRLFWLTSVFSVVLAPAEAPAQSHAVASAAKSEAEALGGAAVTVDEWVSQLSAQEQRYDSAVGGSPRG
ncbi:hypothetical protein HC928_10645 [bacterium]|nr:hypothetical protein [bacterium]